MAPALTTESGVAEPLTNGKVLAAKMTGKPMPKTINGHYQPPTNGTVYEVSPTPVGTIKPMRVINIGAGASGINMAYQTKKHLRNVSLVVYEKNADVGGTWAENRYPGCKCDIPSHNYQFSWEPNPNWSELFSPSAEIKQYLEHCVSKYGLEEYIRVNRQIVGATWDDAKSVWHVRVQNTQTQEVTDDWCDILLNAGGILNNWRWPTITGLHSFKGQLIHSANWPDDASLKDKVVAVIGNGSTGIQIVPAIQPEVRQLVHLIRSPTWVTPGAASRYPSLRGAELPNVFSEEQKKMFREDPERYKEFIVQIEKEINAKFRMLVNGGQSAKDARDNAYNSMVKLLGDRVSNLGSQIIPDFAVGCRRITPGVGYLESFSKPNVRIVADAGIDHVDTTGLVLTTGEYVAVDAIVCATGFDVSFSPRFPITGRNGIRLADLWNEPNVPRAYLSLAIPEFPNYFMFLGPNAPISHGSIFTITENVSRYLMQLITKAQVERLRTITVKQNAVDDFTEHIDTFMPRTAWAGHCRSWFKRGRSTGPITAIHPGSRVHWFHVLERPKFEDFNYTYDTGNRFQYFGNGFSTREEAPNDYPWYLDEVDPKYLYY